MYASSGSGGIVLLLLDKGAMIERADRHGQTSLSISVECGRKSVVKLFPEKDANVNTRGALG